MLLIHPDLVREEEQGTHLLGFWPTAAPGEEKASLRAWAFLGRAGEGREFRLHLHTSSSRFPGAAQRPCPWLGCFWSQRWLLQGLGRLSCLPITPKPSEAPSHSWGCRN